VAGWSFLVYHSPTIGIYCMVYAKDMKSTYLTGLLFVVSVSHTLSCIAASDVRQ